MVRGMPSAYGMEIAYDWAGEGSGWSILEEAEFKEEIFWLHHHLTRHIFLSTTTSTTATELAIWSSRTPDNFEGKCCSKRLAEIFEEGEGGEVLDGEILK